jgi:hypothetical protein
VPLVCILTLFAFSPVSLFPLIFLTALFGFLAAEFPDDAALAKFAVDTGVGAGLAQIQAFLAVAELHFLAEDAGLPVRVKAAFIHQFHAHIILTVVLLSKFFPRSPLNVLAPASCLWY